MATDKSFNTESAEQPKTLVLSSNPNKAMQQMMETIDSLRDVYTEENSALLGSDTKKFLSLQSKKIAAARDYQNCSQQLLERGSDLQHIDIALKEELANKQEEFSGIMTENLKALDTLHKGVKRLNDRVVRSAREAVQNHVNYSATGNLQKNDRSVSMGISETV